MIRNALIVLATGRDRPGIVERMAGVAYESNANFEDSRMSILGGEFALIVLFTGQPGDIEKVRAGVLQLANELDLTVQFKETIAGPEARQPVTGPCLAYRIHGVALDHPGIVHKVTRVLAQQGVNVARLDTSLSNAPITGAPVFSLQIEVEVPASLPVTRLRAELEKVAEAETIDLELRPLDGSPPDGLPPIDADP